MSAKPTYLDELITRLEDNESIDPVLLHAASGQIDGMFDELAQLRADLQAAQERIAEQARQLEEARNLIATVSLESFGTNNSEYLRMKRYVRDKCDAWLASHPAPEAEPQP